MSMLSQLLWIGWMVLVLGAIRRGTRRHALEPDSAWDRFYVVSITVMAAVWIVLPLVDLALNRTEILFDFSAPTVGVFVVEWCIKAWRTMLRR